VDDRRDAAASRTLERHTQEAVVRLLDQSPVRRRHRLEGLLEQRAELHTSLKRALWERRVHARNELRLASTEDRVPAISRWRADAIEAAHRELFAAESRAAQRRFGRKASKEESQARSRLDELLRLAGCTSYDDFGRRIGAQEGTDRDAQVARARAEMAAADAAWDEFEAGRHPELIRLDTEIATLGSDAN